MASLYRDRTEAGQRLASRLVGHSGDRGLLVLGLPRGGVIVASEVARALRAPLDVYVVRKLGVPGYPELAMGDVAASGTRVLSDEVIHALHIPPAMLDEIANREAEEVLRRERLYRGGRPAPIVAGRPVILIDEGLANTSTMRAAVTALQRQEASLVVVAVPVAAPETHASLSDDADEMVCLDMPNPFHSIAEGYEDFDEPTDAEVSAALARAARDHGASGSPVSASAGG